MSTGRPAPATILEWLVARLAELLVLDPQEIDPQEPLSALGLTSREAMSLAGDLERWLGEPLPATLIYEHPHLEALAHALAGQPPATAPAQKPAAPPPALAEPIAIIGLACRFPGADSPAAFWRLLVEGRDAIREIPPERWDSAALYHPDRGMPGKMTTRWAGLIDDVDRFDAPFFGVSPREAAAIDPQQRLMLEVVWEALEHAGIDPTRLAGSPTGVFVGVSTNEYSRLALEQPEGIGAYTGVGSALAVIANRVSYLLDLHGPSLALDTACSSSLVAVHMACQSLRAGETSMALAGGANLLLAPELTIALSQAGMMSPDGRCKTFDAGANGYVRGEGVGVVVLKRLSDARRDGDRVLAQVCGSAVNQDGRSTGLTAPNGQAQRAVVAAALERAGVAPAQIGYVEAHGTGTPLGDPIELRALGDVLGQDRAPERPCLVGSVKTNIGHLEAAAGIAGLIKVVLSFQHGLIPASLHLHQLNPQIALGLSGMAVAGEARPWPTAEHPRYAGVSSFGFGGTNAHVVLAEAPAPPMPAPAPERPAHLLALSARSEAALRSLALRYAEHLEQHPGVAPADVAFTAATGRAHFAHRLTTQTIQPSVLRAFATGALPEGVQIGHLRNRDRPGLTMLFTGQGAQYPDMGRQLYQTQPTFRRALDECADILEDYLDRSLIALLFATERTSDGQHPLDETVYSQPALFALEYALAQLWQSWGVRPDMLAGHSVGEYAAACLAGVFSLEDGLRLVSTRGRLMQGLPRGAMVSVFAEEAALADLLEQQRDRVAIAAINGPAHLVLAGWPDALDALLQPLAERRIAFRQLTVSHAFHSPMMAPICEAFAAAARQISYAPPQLPLVSNLTGALFAPGQIPDADYWTRHLLEPVRFGAGMATLLAQNQHLFLEIGPHPVLVGIGRRNGAEAPARWLASLRRGSDDWHTLLSTLGALYTSGVPVDWRGFDRDYPRRRVELPTYPFERERYWLAHTPRYTSTPAPSPATTAPHPEEAAVMSPQMPRKAAILSLLRYHIGRLFGMEPASIPSDVPFLEMGADSIVLVEAIQIVERLLGVHLSIRLMFEEVTTLERLAAYLDAHAAPEITVSDPLNPATPAAPVQIPHTNGHSAQTNGHSAHTTGHGTHTNGVQSNGHHAPAPLPAAQPAVALDALSQLMNRQLQTLEQVIGQQLDLLRGAGVAQTPAPAPLSGPAVLATPGPSPVPEPVATPAPAPAAAPAVIAPAASAHGPFQPIRPGERAGLTPAQQRFVEELTARYTARTGGSKAATQRHRAYLADNRASVGFRYSTKEMLYPLIAARSEGARIWDIDGNEYLDITMGFGVNLFGHGEPSIRAALERQTAAGIELGPQSPYAGEVAELICELTGVERVSFCNTGTEAVMVALRLARAATGRRRVALFARSYHGHFDGVLARPSGDPQHPSAPIAAGTLPGMVDDLVVLEYDDPTALEQLRAQAHELAAVLVEPVQSRRPDLQPRAFLQALRELTASAGAALIFDEMITGFRIQAGGAQAHFGVRADLVTYGKIVGGGLPIGVVAGAARFLDLIDGGMWQYGDDSYPQVETTFFAGTFCKHPLSMATAHAVLSEIKRRGPALYTELNARAGRLAARMNALFEAEAVPIRLVHFGSLFRFAFNTNLDLLFYLLRDKGVYIWEGRNCMLSTAHTDADIDRLAGAVAESLAELRAGGFLPPRSGGPTPLPVPPAPRRLPLTDGQRQIWASAQLGEDASGAYNEHVTLDLRGPLDHALLEQALGRLVERHEALRTMIAADGSTQLVGPAQPVALLYTRVTDLPQPERETAALDWLADQQQRPFDLQAGPLLRAALVQIDDQRHLFTLTIHHLVSDGASFGVLLHELSAAVEALGTGRPWTPAPALPFATYAEWLDQQLETVGKHERYWLELFAERPPALELPTDRPRPAVKTYAGARQGLRLEAGLWAALQRQSAALGATPFMVLLAAYTALLHRLSGQDDVVVGVPADARALAGAEQMVGYGINLLPVRSRPHDRLTFRQHLHAVRGGLLDAYEHQIYPFARLLGRLKLPRDASRSPLVAATLNVDRRVTLPPLGATKAELVSPPLHRAKFDLSLNATELPGELWIDLEYNRDLFDAATIAAWGEALTTLLRAAINRPDQLLADLPLLDGRARQHLLAEWGTGRVAAVPGGCFHELFAAQAARTPNAPALDDGTRTVSYAELDWRANQLAHLLRANGIKPEVRVGVLIERSVETIVALLGILKAGGVYLPLDPAVSDTRLRWMLEDARPQMLLTTSQREAPAGPWTRIDLQAEQALLGHQPEYPLAGAASPEQTAYMIYTSGSTGQPKGVLVPHRGLTNLAQAQISAFAVGPQSRVLLFASLSFDASLSEIAMALLRGATLVLAPQEDLRTRLGPLLEERAISVVTLPPSLLATLPANGLPALQTVVSAGEPCSTGLIARWAPGRLFVNAYGPTETSVCATLGRCVPGDEPLIGRPLDNMQVYILDRRMQPVPLGVPGELYVGGVGLAHGYHDRPDLTAERFVPNPFAERLEARDLRLVLVPAPQASSLKPQASRLYRTGDLARWRADGRIEFLGRLDQQIKLRGFRIEPGEIEAALREHPRIDDALVLLREDQAGSPRLVAYVVPAQEPNTETRGLRLEASTLDIERDVEASGLRLEASELATQNSALKTFLRERLPEYMLPGAFVTLARFPLNASGKIDRAALPPPGSERPALEQPFVAPRTPVEAELARIWGVVLGLSQIGIHDNFFELGGDSILWLQVVARARTAGVALRQRAIATAATIAELAELAADAVAAPVQTAPSQEDAPLSPIQRWFFEQEFPEPQHWNQALLLRAVEPLDPEILSRALDSVVQQHEALRLRFEHGPEGWRQRDSGAALPPLDLVDQRGLPEAERQQAIAARAGELHRSLDLARGPLLRAALFRGGDGQPDLLLLLLHHLIIDGVSWRVLLDDLQSAYRRIRDGAAPQLPYATRFSDWTRWLAGVATRREIAQEHSYWLALEQARPQPLPRDTPEGDNREASAVVLTTELDAEQTAALTRSGQINAVLLAALLRAFSEWTGASELLVDLEGHGRELGLDGPDISRMVGWCTAAYPLLLRGTRGGTAKQQIKAIGEQLGLVPHGGTGYSLLRYHSPDPALRQRLAALPRPEVCFNYLGRFDQTLGADALLQIAQTSCPPLRSPLAARTHLIEIDCFIVAGGLQIDWTYSSTLHRRATIEGLAAHFKAAVQTLLAAPNAQSATDFPNARISQQQLDRLLSRLSQGKAEPRP